MTGLIFYPFIFSFYLTFHTSFSPVVCLKFTNYSIKALPFVEKPCFFLVFYFLSIFNMQVLISKLSFVHFFILKK